MANLTLKSIGTLVADQAAVAQSKAAQVLDFSTGKVLRALAEANAAIGAWLQGLVLQVLAVSRLVTSSGADVDSFINDWGYYRIGASASAGQVTFSRFTPSSSAVVPLGALVQTSDGLQSFTVVEDDTNGAWSASAQGYVIASGTSSVTVPVRAQATGTATNVAAGAANVLVTTIPGVDYVSNAVPFAGGANSENDAAVKARFPEEIHALSKGTELAIERAVKDLQLGLQCNAIGNVNFDGSTNFGYITVVVDDGTGYPSSDTLAAANIAVGAVRAFPLPWGVFAPTVLTANIVMVLTSADGYDHATIIAQVSAALTSYVNSLPLGSSLPYTMPATIAYGASPGVANVSGVTLNGGTSDIVSTGVHVVKLGSLTVS